MNSKKSGYWGRTRPTPGTSAMGLYGPSHKTPFVWLQLLWLGRLLCRIVSDFSQSNGLKHSRLPCPSPSPGVCSGSCPLNQWCHPTISLILCHSLLPLILPSIKVFSNGHLFTSGGQSIGASASVLPMSILGWFPLGSTGLISFNPYRKCIMIICPECWIMLITPFK